MDPVDRRSTLLLGLAALFEGAKSALAAAGEGKELAKGVTLHILNEAPSKIPPYKKVQLVELAFVPGSVLPPSSMENPMVCQISEGELMVEQDGKTFVAEKGHLWTCNKGTVEGASNKGSGVGIMRMIFLLDS